MQQHHNKLSAQPPPPPGASHPNIYNDRQSKSGTITTMTSLTSITATEPLNDRTSNKQNLATSYANRHPIDDHLQKYGAPYTPSDKQPQQY